jgi:uncharacterized protein (TIGR02284 family)
MDSKNTIKTLNHLIETCKDGEFGFNSCAEHVSSTELLDIFKNRAADCRSAATELQALVSQLGGEAEREGTTSGAMHRGWVSVKGMLTGYSDQAMLEECERGEDVALARYRDALDEELPVHISVVVERQYQGAKRNHNQIRALRDMAREHS